MKITKIKIAAFGQFSEQTFDLIGNRQFIYGLNEAGKSTLYHFINYILFGFETANQRRRDFKPISSSRLYGGSLWLDTATVKNIKVTRFYNTIKKEGIQKNVAKVELPTGETGGEALLAELLYPLNKQVFSAVYSFQQEQLAELDKLTAKDLEDTLIVTASTGSKGLFEQLKRLRKAKEALFKPNGSNPPINQALKNVTELQQTIQQKEQQERHVQASQAELTTIEQAITSYQKAQTELREQINQLSTQVDNLPAYHDYQALLQQQKTRYSSKDETRQQQLSELIEAWQGIEYERIDVEKRIKEAQQKLLDNNTQEFHFYQEHQAEIESIAQDSQSVAVLTNELASLAEKQASLEQQLQLTEVRWQFQRDYPPLAISDKEFSQLHQYHKEEQKRSQQQVKRQTELQALVAQQATLEQELLQAEEAADAIQQKRRFTPYLLFLSGVLLALLTFVLLTDGLGAIVAMIVFVGTVMATRQVVRNKPTFKSDAELTVASLQTNLSRCLAKQTEIDDQASADGLAQRELAEAMQQFSLDHQLAGMDNLSDLVRFGVDANNYAQQVQFLHQMRERAGDLQLELAAYDQQTELLAPWLPFQNVTVQEKYQTIQQFVQTMYQRQLDNAGNDIQRLTERAAKLASQEQDLLQHYPTLLASLPVAKLPAAQQELQVIQEKQRQQVDLDQRALFLEKYFDLSQPVEEEQIIKERQRLQQEWEELEEKRQERQSQAAQLKGQLNELTQHGTLDEWYQRRANEQSQLQELVNQWLSLQASEQVFEKMIKAMSDQTLPELLENASYYFTRLTGGSYQEIRDHEGNLEIQRRDGVVFRPIDLSTGTKDQLYLALRLSFIASESSIEAPLLVDDGWLHYDHQRKEYLLAVFNQLSQTRQVLIFSSDDHFKTLANEADWQFVPLIRGGKA